MNGSLLEVVFRRVAIVALLGVAVFLLLRLSADDEVDGSVLDEERLAERVEEFVALRKADDQVGLYNITDPEQQKIKTLQEYLKFHMAGVTKILEISWSNPRIDHQTQRALVTLDQTVELQPDRLPPPYNKLQEEHPEHLRATAKEELEWVWREGDWYLRMDRTFVSGRAADGRPIQSLGEQTSQK